MTNSETDFRVLGKLGFSRAAITCYQNLLMEGSANAAELSGRLCKPRTDLYRTLKHLEETGFVASLKTSAQPRYYRARPIDEAMNYFVAWQLELVSPLAGPLIFRPGRLGWDLRR